MGAAIATGPTNVTLEMGTATDLGISIGDIVVSNATDAAGNSSEFSNHVTVVRG
jgi:hypothetical protein